jgi:hypothetical protein
MSPKVILSPSPAFAKDEVTSEEQSGKKKVSFTALHVDTKDCKFNRDEANKR